jgi:small subunit ribosomal protein S9
MEKKVIYATGRRKTSKARIFLRPGSGMITINDLPADRYLSTGLARMTILQPLVLTDMQKNFDMMVTVAGGGIKGQAEAIRHGVSRALCTADETFRGALKKAGFLTRDPRMVERKKYGKHKARKSTQFSKR